MKKLLLLACLVMSCAGLAAAQSSDDYYKNEFFAGYSYNRFSDSDAAGSSGVNVAYVYNFSRYIGAKADFSAHFRKDNFSVGTLSVSTRSDVYRFMGGVQIKDNSKDTKVKPFAHALIGGGSLRASTSGIPGSNNFSDSTAAFAFAVGGGLDIKANDRISVRVAQVDYAPLYREGIGHAVRFSAGIIFH